jgi:DnaJ-class molecular chaperone
MEGYLIVCSVCGKPLERRECTVCAGSGKVSAGLFGKRACKACGGKGSYLRCPSLVAHLAERHPKAGQGELRRTAHGSSVHPLCPRCHGMKVTFVGNMEIPCTECDGRGWV